MDRTCFILGGADVKDDCDAVTLSTVLSRVSLRCQLREFSCSSTGTTTTQRVYYLSTEQYKMVTNLTNQIAASVNAPTAGPLSEDELEARTEAGEIAQQTVGQRKRKRKVPNPDKKAAKAAEAERVRNVLMHWSARVCSGQGSG